MNQRIIIKVATDGSTQVRTEGFTGNRCRLASAFIERALGSQQSEQLTADYFKSCSVAQPNQLKHGESE